jgi:protoheme IX farnesyltransferase
VESEIDLSTQVITRPEVTPLPLAARLGDYVQLSRPKIGVMVLVTAWLGMLLAGVAVESSAVVMMLVGTALVTTGASAFNQLAERRTDARMLRTENRPLPAGRLSIGEVFAFASFVTAAGLIVLALLPSGPAAALVAATTFVLYVFVYTPAKRRTWLNTFIGAVPGAMPPLIGWAAARGTLTLESLPLFAILFFWQVPHFLAIAWIYRDDYRRAGLKMLPVHDAGGSRTLRTMVLHTLALIAASLWPLAYGAGWAYAAGALALGLIFLALVFRFGADRSVRTARAVLKMSLVYLPGVLLVLFVDRLI